MGNTCTPSLIAIGTAINHNLFSLMYNLNSTLLSETILVLFIYKFLRTVVFD